MWQPNLDNRRGALYRMIADALADDIAAGRLPAGTRLPTHRALADRVGVTVGTITRAYAEAERRGLVDATVGRGTFVRQGTVFDDGANNRFPAMRPDTPVGSYRDNLSQVLHRTLPSTERTSEVADFSANYPVSTPIGPALARAMQHLTDPARWAEVGGYQPANGRADHRKAGADWLARTGLHVDPDEVILVSGAQGGQSIAFQALCRPGDAVMVEELTWPGIKAVAQAQGLRLVPVAMDGEGLRPDSLAEACARSGARVLYCIPTLHNPTNVTMSAERRREILKVAAAHDITVVEDDVYGFLHAGRHEPLAQMDRDRVVHVTSVSKSVAPGLRTGFLVSPRGQVGRFAGAIRCSTLMASSVAAECASILIANGGAKAAADAQTQEAEARQRLAAKYLGHLKLHADPRSFHAWLELPAPWRTAQFAAQALSRGIVVTPGHAFAINEDPDAVRICLSAVPDRGLLERGLRDIADLLAVRPEAALPVV
jgi:DNA-binding transcriptional MocR family regulator